MMHTTKTNIGAMSAEEIDTAIGELQQRQAQLAPRWQPPGSFGFGQWHKPPSVKSGGWHSDAEKLRGDMERVGIDMWIGVLRAAQARKTA